MRKIKTTIFGVILAINISIYAQSADYYLDASTLQSAGKIYVNGFEVFDKSGSGMVSMLLTPYLVEGENTVEVVYEPNEKSTENSKIEVKVESNPHGVRRRLRQGETLLKAQLGSRKVRLNTLENEKLDLMKGSRKKGNVSGFVFERSNGVCRFEANIKDKAKSFRRRPSKVKYFGLNQQLQNAKIILKDTRTNERIVFGPFNLTKGNGSLELEQVKVLEGAEFLKKKGFDSISLEADSESEKETEVALLEFYEIRGNDRDEYTFTVRGVPRWSWTNGMNTRNLPNQQLDRLWQRVIEIRNALDQGDIEACKQIFRFKTKDLAMAMGKEASELDADQVSFFQELTSQATWGMIPVDVNNLTLKTINEKIVKVETKDGKDPLESEPILDPDGDQNTFTIPLFMSNIQGKWEVVR